MSCNRAQICGRLETRRSLRFTPAGVALIEFELSHKSEQTEAGGKRKVAYTLPAIAVEDLAREIAQLPLKCECRATGFLASASHTDTKLVLHVQKIELID